MRRVLKKIIEILDGTPAVQGKKQRGQSMVELALVSPLLVIVLAGMVEIGWFARNYMILLEVTRVGARTGTVQQGELAPLSWDNGGSIMPGNYGSDDGFNDAFPPDEYGGNFRTVGWPAAYRNCNASSEAAIIGFYNFVSCIMLRSIDPLPFGRIQRGITDDTVVPDDIVVSAFAIQTVDPEEADSDSLGPAIAGDIEWPLGPDAGPQAIVVGRWPSNANECHFDQSGNPYPGDADDGLDGRDPFDWIKDSNRTVHPANALLDPGDLEERHYLEVAEPDSGVRERQRGFAWNGIHQITDTGCYGSEWDIDEIQNLINLQNFNLTTTQRAYVPSQGMILVEMWWQHESISQFVGLSPVVSPVFAMLGTDTTIYVWAAFPLPQVEPRIDFTQ